MGAFALWGMVAAGWLLLRPATGDSGPAATASVSGVGRTSADVDESRQSIAVLPFTNRSAGTEEEAGFFASGIHDDILTQLSKIDALKVISRTSVMQYEDTQKTIGQIGHESEGRWDEAEIALIYGQLGEVDRAFEYLERTYQTDPGDLLFLMSDPSADPLRDDPRFDELAERAGLK